MEKTENISISIPKDLKEKINKIAEAEDRTRSAVIIRLIKVALEEYEHGAYK